MSDDRDGHHARPDAWRPDLRERMARLEEKLLESERDRGSLHVEIGAAFGRLDVLERDMIRAKAGMWLAGVVGSIAGFVVGILQPWIGLHR